MRSTHLELYTKAKESLLTDKKICLDNRELFRKFFEYEEKKLKRMNSLSTLDEGTFKSLYGYCTKLRNVNIWFKNKPWKDLTEEEIRTMINDFEDGKIKNARGARYKDRAGYYNRIFRSKPFDLAGKLDIVKKVMEEDCITIDYSSGVVRFITEDDFLKMVDSKDNVYHKLALWIMWDIGENAFSLMQLKKKDCTRQVNLQTNEPEYLINLREEILKRSRTPRVELTNYSETARLLDLVLETLEDDDSVFDYGLRNAEKIVSSAATFAGVKTNTGKNVTAKDLRSSMACHLLKQGWSKDEVNGRLGHKPSSKEIDKYANYFALDKNKSKSKLYPANMIMQNYQIQTHSIPQKQQALQPIVVQPPSNVQSPIDILNMRLAKGEISLVDYKQTIETLMLTKKMGEQLAMHQLFNG